MSASALALHRLKHDHLLQALLILTLALAILDPRPSREYLRWLDVPTLAGLTGLLILTQAVRISGLVQRWALALVSRLSSVRMLAIALVLLSAVLASVLTNDVALFLIVPLTLAIDAIARIPRTRLVIFEALAVNAGSTLSPIGNPQNLLLWQHSGLAFPQFTLALLPAGAIMLALLLCVTCVAFSSAPLQLQSAVEPPRLNVPLGVGATLLLGGMVAALQFHYAVPAMLAVFAAGLLFFRRVLAGVDWMLLVTFAAMFVGLGHLSAVPWVNAHVGMLDWHDPRVLYGGGVVLSQAISNVPAAVLLQHYTRDLTLLAIAVNVGGSGIMIGSLANLIALRLDGSPRIAWKFHAWSIPYLLASAVLVGVWAVR
ncbi:MAG TPA: SLC13 family permease [Rhodanobacteraceae bacterium]|nr:SLC13 family permease [Rhodanobacteraceae bacterium]